MMANMQLKIIHQIARQLSTSSSLLAGSPKVLNINSMNPNIKDMEFAVRGPIVIRGEQLEQALKKGEKKPFTSIVRANIGDAHDMGQKPITFLRQVCAGAAYPDLLKGSFMPKDVVENVNEILDNCGGRSIGAYTKSAGIDCIRKHCAEYITRRDGIETDADNIIITNGASEGIRNILKLFANNQSKRQVGIMIPIPQYPLYSASLTEFNLAQVKYYLDEETNWSLNVDELERSFADASKQFDVKAICVINPGNPTAQVLSRKNIEDVVRFAERHKLFILADEVYQENIHEEDMQFYSFKKVVKELGGAFGNVELASFFSVSKGYMGECGVRSGYTELYNVDPDVVKALTKMISAKLCAGSLGQIALDCAVNPPKPGGQSYDLWLTEKTDTLNSMRVRARLVQEAYNSLEGIKCRPLQGALYALPKIDLPAKAIKAAQELNMQPDFFYGMQLLEETGICTVPGSGFGQKEGTYHFRTTILPQMDLMKEMLERFKPFHSKFMNKYR